MDISADNWSKYAAFHRYWWHLQMSEKFSGEMKKNQTNKQTNNTDVNREIHKQDIALIVFSGCKFCYFFFFSAALK